MTAKVYTWYTAGSPYRELAAQVVDDCRRLHMEAEAIEAPPFNSWDHATDYKSQVALQILSRDRSPFWLVDADSRVEGIPLSPRSDFAGHWFRGRELQGSVLFFRPGALVDELVGRWDRENKEKAGRVGDQLNLMTVVPQVQGLTITQLPAQYCFIFDLSRDHYGNLAGVVFRQTQASRRFKHIVTKQGHENTAQVCLKKHWSVEAG